jgi:tetrahydromethanopterin S-methyltransferase subunit A
VAIAGRCDTENIGVEKVVLNLLANPRIRWLVICGQDPDSILAAARDCASKPLQPLPTAPADSACCGNALAAVEHIRAKAPKCLQLDRAGFFVVLPQPRKGLIVCEHYENSGRLAHVIEGRQAALIAATVVERGLVTQLDHAAYLGRELAKAEAALSIGITYEQDAALGQLATSQQWEEPHKTKEPDCECSKTSTCTP